MSAPPVVLQALTLPGESTLLVLLKKPRLLHSEPSETLRRQLASQNLRKTRQPDTVQQKLLSKIFWKADVVKRGVFNTDFYSDVT